MTNEKRRLSQEEIERIIANSEQFKDQDVAVRKKTDAENDIE
jgi:molecular chaperone DnaK (HSP70)